MQAIDSSIGFEVPAGPVVRAARRGRSPLYTGLAVLMTAIVVGGFWRSYFGPALRGNIARPWVIQLHGVVFVGWMLLLLAQVGLVATGRTRAHRALGQFGIYYGFVLLLMGIVVSFAAGVLHVTADPSKLDAEAGFLIIPLGDMVLFSLFFIPAVVYRRKPELHKRFIVLATTALLFAAIGRMDAIIPSTPVLIALWLSPPLAALGHELVVRRRLDRIYLGGIAVLALAAARVMLVQWEPWVSVGRAALHRLM
jgi:hypothetical protein